MDSHFYTTLHFRVLQLLGREKVTFSTRTMGQSSFTPDGISALIQKHLPSQAASSSNVPIIENSQTKTFWILGQACDNKNAQDEKWERRKKNPPHSEPIRSTALPATPSAPRHRKSSTFKPYPRPSVPRTTVLSLVHTCESYGPNDAIPKDGRIVQISP